MLTQLLVFSVKNIAKKMSTDSFPLYWESAKGMNKLQVIETSTIAWQWFYPVTYIDYQITCFDLLQ